MKNVKYFTEYNGLTMAKSFTSDDVVVTDNEVIKELIDKRKSTIYKSLLQ